MVCTKRKQKLTRRKITENSSDTVQCKIYSSSHSSYSNGGDIDYGTATGSLEQFQFFSGLINIVNCEVFTYTVPVGHSRQATDIRTLSTQ